MNRDAVLPVILICALVAVICTAQEQTVPPLKPGLWQIHQEREVNGQKVPAASERMKSMSPEKRAQIEAMMKRNGLGMDANGQTQVCYTREALEKSPWNEQQTGCSYSTRTASSWKWHTSCPNMGVESDGESAFPDRENYTVKSTSAVKTGDTVRNSTMTMTGKWVSADCGDLKPIGATP